MKNIFSDMTERHIAIITLLLSAAALVAAVALPEIRSMFGLNGSGEVIEYDGASMYGSDNDADIAEVPDVPEPPEEDLSDLPLVEITETDTIMSVKKGEFIISPGVSFVIKGVGKGKMTIKENARVEVYGVFKGDVINEGGTFKVYGIHEGALKRAE